MKKSNQYLLFEGLPPIQRPKVSKLHFREAWVFPRPVHELIESLLESPSLHVCCGSSNLCDTRIDLLQNDIVKPEIQASGWHLPIRPQSQKTIVTDPPWKIGYRARFTLLQELRDALIPDGKIILDAPWIPRVKHMFIERCWVSTWRWGSSGGYVTVYRKVNSQFNLGE